jgi:hypothetical protein
VGLEGLGSVKARKILAGEWEASMPCLVPGRCMTLSRKETPQDDGFRCLLFDDGGQFEVS